MACRRLSPPFEDTALAKTWASLATDTWPAFHQIWFFLNQIRNDVPFYLKIRGSSPNETSSFSMSPVIEWYFLVSTEPTYFFFSSQTLFQSCGFFSGFFIHHWLLGTSKVLKEPKVPSIFSTGFFQILVSASCDFFCFLIWCCFLLIGEYEYAVRPSPLKAPETVWCDTYRFALLRHPHWDRVLNIPALLNAVPPDSFFVYISFFLGSISNLRSKTALDATLDLGNPITELDLPCVSGVLARGFAPHGYPFCSGLRDPAPPSEEVSLWPVPLYPHFCS